MTMREGERWIRSNPECRCEVYVVTGSTDCGWDESEVRVWIPYAKGLCASHF